MIKIRFCLSELSDETFECCSYTFSFAKKRRRKLFKQIINRTNKLTVEW